MRSESESELGNQLSGILRKASKQICIWQHTCVSVFVYVCAERERISVTLVTTAAQACVSDLCMCVHARVFAGTISLISLLGLFCLPVHTVTQTHTHTHTSNTKKKGKYMSSQPRETRTLTEAMKDRQKRRVTGPTTGCCPKQDTCIEEKQRVRPPAVRHTQQNKQKKNKHIHTHTQVCMLVCMIV